MRATSNSKTVSTSCSRKNSFANASISRISRGALNFRGPFFVANGRVVLIDSPRSDPAEKPCSKAFALREFRTCSNTSLLATAHL